MSEGEKVELDHRYYFKNNSLKFSKLKLKDRSKEPRLSPRYTRWEENHT